MSHPCEACTRPVDDARVCSTCGRDVERALGNIPALDHELELTITRQTRIGARSDRRGAETPLPFHVKAGDLRDEMKNILVGWCRLYADEAGADLPADNPAAMSRYLLTRAEWLRHHEAAYDFVTEVTGIVKRVARIVDLPVNRSTFAVGKCPEVDVDGAPCPGEIRAHIPADEDEPAWIGCHECHARWETWQWFGLGKRLARVSVA